MYISDTSFTLSIHNSMHTCWSGADCFDISNCHLLTVVVDHELCQHRRYFEENHFSA